MAVYFFIQNLIHKCESILIDQLEYFIILNQAHSFDFTNDKAKNRFKRIFGSRHPLIKNI